MPIRSFLAAITSLLLATTVASAQPFIEFHVQGGLDGEGETPFGVFEGYLHVDFKVVIDASAAPTDIGGGLIFYDAVFADHFPIGSGDMPIRSGDRTAVEPGYTILDYNPALDSLTITAFPFKLTITDLVGDFSDAATSLPGDPDAYLLDVEGANPEMLLTSFFPQLGVRWTPAGGFELNFSIRPTGFHVRVRTVDDPRIPECIADLNGDGMLDFLDISDYLLAYTTGCETVEE